MNAKKAERNKRAVVFDDQVDQFNRYLSESLDSITKEAQKFYSKHFSNNDVEVLTLRLGLHQVASQFDADAPEVTPPRLGFEIKVGLKIIHRPHTFLNEAKLTQLALSVRFGASLIKLRESPLKLLVLDDLLISLDMNNRIPVVDIILGEDFQDYQKIILTHDIGFFKEFRRRIGPAHVDWSFQRFTGNAKGQIALIADRSDVEKARTYLNEQKLDEAANCLRKAAEDMAARLRECYAKFPVEIGEFQTLSKNLGIAKNKLISQLPTHIYDRIQDRFANKAFDQNALDALKTLFVEQELHAFDCLQVIDEVLKTTERVLNPGSHGGDAPLYETEVAKALLLIEKFLANGDILLSTIQNKP